MNPNLEIESFFLSTNLSRCCPGARSRTPEMILNQSCGYDRGKKINLDIIDKEKEPIPGTTVV